MKKLLGIVLSAALICFLTACAQQPASQTSEKETVPVSANLSKTDMTKWKYNEDNDFYYQTEIAYCETPADKNYEQLALFVPAAYMDAAKNNDGTYTCTLNETAEINGYTAGDAPIVMAVETPGYHAAEPMTESVMNENPIINEIISEYISQGMVFVYPGCRGIEEGVPAGVTDLKAAVRYIRYCDDVIAGDAESVFVSGTSGGGAQAAVLGASGDSELYDPYLKAIGAVQGVSDAVKGSMDWCPITSLDTANAEYEWMMGCTRPKRSEEEQTISDKLAAAYADYVNSAGFTDENDNALTLTESENGIYQAGSYYEYIKSVIEKSLNNYLADNDFSDPSLHNSYGSAQGYIDELNKDSKWVTYDKNANTAAITSVADFAKACKNASDLIVAFDQPQSENNLFGCGDGKSSHFDSILAGILTEMNSEYASDYNTDLAKTDSFGNTVAQRVDMYSPLYYLMKSRGGYGKSTVAKYWRIRSGIEQSNTSLTTEVNLALALEHCDGVEGVDFETVWGEGHTEAERTGESIENFIKWINDCMKG